MEVCTNAGLSANLMQGRHMRYCETCEVAVGIMSRKEWFDRFIEREGLCPVCGKSAGIVPEEEEE